MAADESYADLIRKCLAGPKVTTRNSDCYRTVCQRYRFTQTPLVTLRKTAWRSALREWEWFMSGSNRLDDLHPSVQSWWKPWASPIDGRIRFNYSVQFRHGSGQSEETTDQIAHLIDGIKDHPNGRRHVITTWNAADMLHPDCPLTNCHNTMTQCFVDPDGTLNMKTYQRSADVVVGLPANWIQQWAFLTWLARLTNKKVGWLEWEGGDCHVYAQHRELAERIVAERPLKAPELVYTPTTDDFCAADFTLSSPYLFAIGERAEMVV